LGLTQAEIVKAFIPVSLTTDGTSTTFAAFAIEFEGLSKFAVDMLQFTIYFGKPKVDLQMVGLNRASL